jgi:hypothetical protein
MRKRVSWLVFFVICIGVAALVTYHNIPSRNRMAVPATATSDSSPSTLPRDSTSSFYVQLPSGPYEGPNDPRWKAWNSMKTADRLFEWKMPITFYGKVVDDNLTPVPGASVRYGWNDVEGSHEKRTASDANGEIKISGITGKILSVDVQKEGYHSSRADRHSFEYAAFFEGDYYHPDSNNPVTFHLTKKLEAKRLIAHHLSQRVSYDEPIYYDLERGTLNRQPPEAGSLRLKLQRAESRQGEPFSWSWTIESVNGGLQETADEFPQLAPEAGYVPSWTLPSGSTAERFEPSGHARFYIRVNNNKYGCVDMDVGNPNSRQLGARVTINSYLNPTPGSRNLEFDPKKQIKTQ